MPFETGITCQSISPVFTNQQTMTKLRLTKTPDQFLKHDDVETNCPYCSSLPHCDVHSNLTMATQKRFRKHSCISVRPHQNNHWHKLKCDAIPWRSFEKKISNFFRGLFRLQFSFLLSSYLFFAIFFIPFIEAAPVLSTQNDNNLPSFNANRTSATLFDQNTVSLLQPISHEQRISVERSKTSIEQSSFKVKRASEVHKRKTKKSPKRRKNKRKKGKKKPKKGRGRKKSKVKTTSFPTDIRKHHGPSQPNINRQGASPRRQRLYNKNGISYHLAVWPNGTVSGEKSNKGSRYSVLEIQGISEGGIVSIMGVEARKYICVTKKGAVKAKKRFDAKRCRFEEQILQNHQNTYRSLSCSKCYLNLRKNGKVRRLKKTNPHLPQAHFLPRLTRKRFKRLESKRGKVLTIIFPDDVQRAMSEEIKEEELPLASLNEDPRRPSSSSTSREPTEHSKNKESSNKNAKHKFQKRLKSNRHIKNRRKTTSSKSDR